MHSKYLWNFHALHHSPKSLNWLSGMRGTFLHYVFMMTPYLIAASLFLRSEERYVFWVLIFTNALIQNLTHSNIRLPFAKYLQFVFITPNLHFVHHHPNPVYTNSNYGFVFSFWDRVFGTFTEPDHVKSKGQLGLDYEINNLSLILGFKVGQNSNPELVEEATKKSA